MEFSPQPPYSPHLAPSDSHLFRPFHVLKRKRFNCRNFKTDTVCFYACNSEDIYVQVINSLSQVDGINLSITREILSWLNIKIKTKEAFVSVPAYYCVLS